jgi:hypothetical protein
MKIVLKHLNHRPSESITALISRHLADLAKRRRIDESRVLIEHCPHASPPFRVAAHLVTPGPDFFAESFDYTLRAALAKVVLGLGDDIGERHAKRVRRLRRSANPVFRARA